jgi:hypothetical protein
MRSCGIRCLVLIYSLVLALPAGWCCMLPLPSAPAALRASAPIKPCGCCCGCTMDEPASPPSSPSRKTPVPSDPAKCCCADRHTIISSGPEQLGPDLMLVGSIPLDEVLSAFVGLLNDSPLSGPFPCRPLHILDCVWLC